MPRPVLPVTNRLLFIDHFLFYEFIYHFLLFFLLFFFSLLRYFSLTFKRCLWCMFKPCLQYVIIQEAARLALDKVTSAVLIVNIGSDSKAIKRAIDEIKKAFLHLHYFSLIVLKVNVTVSSYLIPSHLVFHQFLSLPLLRWQVSQDMSFLCISSDAEKLTVFAYATEASLAMKEGEGGLRANEWVSRTLSVR